MRYKYARLQRIGLAVVFCALALPVHATAHGHKHHRANFVPAGLVTVPTAAGIRITVAADFAAPMQGFISDLTARGIRPAQIHCYSWARSHVRHSLHHQGRACDFNGSANLFRPMNRHRVADLAQRYGLRDGCGFGDCGHIDAGFGRAKHRRVHLVRR